VEYRLELKRENVQLPAGHHDADLTGRLGATASSWDPQNVFSVTMSESLRSAIRDMAERGDWKGGIIPDGYRVLREIDSRGKVARTINKDPDRLRCTNSCGRWRWRIAPCRRSNWS
jgi:hypothetical protein